MKVVTGQRTDGSTTRITVSVVVAAKNEEESVPVLAREIESVLDARPLFWECIWVDDGSTDHTLERLEEIRVRRAEHRLVSFDRNYGQSAAMMGGIRAARGGVIVTLDADLQNDPADIPKLLDALTETGADMVNGVRINRRDTWIRRLSSRIANGFRNRMTRDSITDVGCSLRAFRAECADDLILWNGMHRFLPTLVRMAGYRLTEVPVAHRPRSYGRGKYGVNNRLWRGLRDTLGVRWLQDRHVRPRIQRSSPPDDRDARTVSAPHSMAVSHSEDKTEPAPRPPEEAACCQE